MLFTPRSFLTLCLNLLSFSLVVLPAQASNETFALGKRNVCSNSVQTAQEIAATLQKRYFKTKPCSLRMTNEGYCKTRGTWKGTGHWQAANIVEDLLNLNDVSGTKKYDSIRTRSDDLRSKLYTDASDDAGWGALMFIRLNDYFQTDQYNKDIDKQYKFMEKRKDDKCGGGIWWTNEKGDYKNTISNALFMHVSMALYLRRRDKKYLDNALWTWKFLINSGLRGNDGIWMDGVHWQKKQCFIQSTKWTYTQGVVASALSIMGKEIDKSYYDEAEKTLDGVRDHMTTGGILREACDDRVDDNCNIDQQQFKGIYMKHLQYYLDSAPHARDKWAQWIWDQSSGVYHYATNSDGEPSHIWYAPDEGKARWNANTVDSGLAAHIAAAKYSNCGPSG